MDENAQTKLRDLLAIAAELPIYMREELVTEFTRAIHDLNSSVTKLPEPDFSGKSYPLYIKRTDPLEHLDIVWGKYMKRTNPDLTRDYIDQKQLNDRDPVLMRAIRNRIRTMPGSKVPDFVPPYKGSSSNSPDDIQP